jgi:hypothetical protein
MRKRRWATLILLTSVFTLAVIGGPAESLAAGATHPFLFELRGFVSEPGHVVVPPPEGEFEDACGVAVDTSGDVYISDYYHRTIDVYTHSHEYLTQIADPDPDGPCNLAVDAEGNLYVNHWRRNVVRYAPSHFPPTSSTSYSGPVVLDSPSSPGARSTGVFLDPASGDLYVDDRTYVAVYASASLDEAEPAPIRRIDLGALAQGYGVAVSDFGATEGDVYVPDAVSGTVKIYDSLGGPVGEIDGAGTPQHGFVSLLDSSVAVDQSDGHLFVADNTEVGFESPGAVVDEFNATGEYRGQLPNALTDAEPTALAVDDHRNVYATSGNSEGAVLYGFGPTAPASSLRVARVGEGSGAVTSVPAGIDCGTACAAEYNVGEEVVLTALPASGSTFAGWSGGGCTGTGSCHVIPAPGTEIAASFATAPETMAAEKAAATPQAAVGAVPAGTRIPPAEPGRGTTPASAQSSEVEQKGQVRVSVNGKLTPHKLPRHGAAPVRVAVGVRVAAVGGGPPPQLRKFAIAINRHGHFDPAALPRCPLREIQPSTTSGAMKACRRSLVGEGFFSANVLLPEQSPFPSAGKVVAFNGSFDGHPAILAHVYGTRPVPTSYTIPFEITPLKGTFGTLLSAPLPRSTSQWGYVTGISLNLNPTTGHGQTYLSAGCPAPKGFSAATFPFARVTLSFVGQPSLGTTITRSCTARGGAG